MYETDEKCTIPPSDVQFRTHLYEPLRKIRLWHNSLAFQPFTPRKTTHYVLGKHVLGMYELYSECMNYAPFDTWLWDNNLPYKSSEV